MWARQQLRPAGRESAIAMMFQPLPTIMVSRCLCLVPVARCLKQRDTMCFQITFKYITCVHASSVLYYYLTACRPLEWVCGTRYLQWPAGRLT
jgi:hypothetical protein